MKKIKISIIFFIYLLFISAYSNAMASEEAEYNIVNKTDIYEIRYYEDRYVVQVFDLGQDNSFRKLFNYISGSNNKSEKINMTIPVTESINKNKQVMQFYLPSKFTKDTIPTPSNSDVEISTIKAGFYAVIKYSGRSSDKNFLKHSKILQQELLKDKILIIGPAIKATYNGPFILPPFRRNEAMFNVDWKS
tara:strand:+ start:1018 stop:1590 length:573 start_codon:yes stop_codon:yes gene_type:complete